MYRNFLRIASANIKTKLLNVEENSKNIKNCIHFAKEKEIDVLLFPELTLTGISAGQMIASKEIVNRSLNALKDIIKSTSDSKTLVVLGSPVKIQNAYYNVLFAIQDGNIIGAQGKANLSYEESKYFTPLSHEVFFENNDIQAFLQRDLLIRSFDSQVLIQMIGHDNLLSSQFNESANLILVAGNKPTDAYSLDSIKNNLASLSKQENIGIVYAGPSDHESSSNSVYSAEKYILECGNILDQGRLFTNGLIYNEINLDEVNRKLRKYPACESDVIIDFSESKLPLKRKLPIHPYIPENDKGPATLANILEIQARALVRRMKQIPEKKIFLGLSGGLDSTLSLLAAIRAFKIMEVDLSNIHTVTMPGLGTSDRTKNNALDLAKGFGVSIDEISIKESVLQHFKDIDHAEDDYSAAYENAQARERTQVLMDLSNKHGGIVLGTGNMSEIALGWATYNGDHMSMYAVNSGLPKIMLREVVRFVMDNSDNQLVKETLADIIDTPVSPELLPANEDGTIKQKTEESVGPYELHDFFIYHLVRNNSQISDIYYMAKNAFDGKYTDQEIKKWLRHLLRRFTSQQFKRNVAVDGPLLLDYSINPKFGFTMPSDIDIEAFMYTIDKL